MVESQRRRRCSVDAVQIKHISERIAALRMKIHSTLQQKPYCNLVLAVLVFRYHFAIVHHAHIVDEEEQVGFIFDWIDRIGIGSKCFCRSV